MIVLLRPTSIPCEKRMRHSNCSTEKKKYFPAGFVHTHAVRISQQRAYCLSQLTPTEKHTTTHPALLLMTYLSTTSEWRR